MFWFEKKKRYNVLPNLGHSYVMANSMPMLTYFRPNSGLFCDAPLSDKDRPYFLNIRRPIVIDVKDISPICIPNDLPDECDGIIFTNYGIHYITAFYVKDKQSQSMSV